MSRVAAGVHADTGLSAADADARYQPQGLPTIVGTRTRPFDADRSLYNAKASNLRRTKATLGKAAVGSALARLGFVGDSLTGGPTTGRSDPATRLQEHLDALGFRVSRIAHAWNNSGGPDAQISLSVGAGFPGSPTQTFPWASFVGTGGTLIFGGRGTIMEIVTRGDTAAWSYAIDGGAPVTISPSGSAAMQVITVTGLEDIDHSVTITSAAGTNYVYGAGMRYDTGVVVENGGIWGTTTAQWTSTASGAFAPLASLLARGLTTLFVELGVNDNAGSVAAATYKTNLTSIVTQAQTAGCEVVLVVSQKVSAAGALWDSYVSAAYDIADSLDLPLLDLTDRLGPYATWNTALGLGFNDGLHLNAAGAELKTFALAAALDVPAPAGAGREALAVARAAGRSLVANDPFTGANGTAPGPAWTVSGTGTIQSNALQLVTGTGGYDGAAAVRAGLKHGEIVTSFAFGTALAERYGSIEFRRVDGGNMYRVQMSPSSLALQKVVSYGSTGLAGIGGLNFAVGAAYLLRVRWLGTRIQARVWAVGSAEPETWQIDVDDPTYTEPGTIGLSVLTGGAGGALTGVFDEFRLWNIAPVAERLTTTAAAAQPSTAYTLASTDAGRVLECTNGSATTVTVPPNSSVPLPVGATLQVCQYGAGQVTIAAGAGVTLRARGGALKTSGQYGAVSLRKRATDEWVVTGDITT